MVTIEYRIDPQRESEFIAATHHMRRIRQRDGAFFREVFQDAADSARFTESFMNESWVEHLRQQGQHGQWLDLDLIIIHSYNY